MELVDGVSPIADIPLQSVLFHFPNKLIDLKLASKMRKYGMVKKERYDSMIPTLKDFVVSCLEINPDNRPTFHNIIEV